MNYNYGDNLGSAKIKPPDVSRNTSTLKKTYILMNSGPSGMHCCLTMTCPTLTSRFQFQA